MLSDNRYRPCLGGFSLATCFRAVTLVCFIALTLTGCGSDLPDYDEDATYNGKPLSEYAVGLSDLNPRQRATALWNIAKFGVNGLPVREQIQAMALEDTDHTVRVAALATLHGMQDPGLPELYQQVLADANYADSAKIWSELAKGAGKVFTQEELEKQAKSIAGNDLEHAKTLFKASSGSKLEVPLAKVLIDKELDPATLQRLVRVVPRLDLSEDEKIDFMESNWTRFPNSSVALNGLRSIGGEKAFDAALTIIRANTGNLQNSLSAITSFGATVDPAKVISVLAALAVETDRSESDLQQIFSSMNGQFNTLAQNMAVRQGQTEDPAYKSYTVAAKVYTNKLKGLTESNNPQVRALAALYLIQGSGGYQATLPDIEVPLASVLGMLETEQAEVVLGTITAQLQSRIARVDIPQDSELPKQFAAAVYARSAGDKWAYSVADGLLKTINTGATAKKFDRLEMIRLLSEQAKANAGHPANLQLFDSILATTRNRMVAREMGDAITEVANIVGRLALDAAITQSHIDKTFSSSNPGNLTIATQAPSTDAIIAFMDPMVMSQDAKFAGNNPMTKRFFDMILNTNIYYLRGHADREKYIEWVRKVAQSGHKGLRPLAVQGLKRNGV